MLRAFLVSTFQSWLPLFLFDQVILIVNLQPGEWEMLEILCYEFLFDVLVCEWMCNPIYLCWSTKFYSHLANKSIEKDGRWICSDFVCMLTVVNRWFMVVSIIFFALTVVRFIFIEIFAIQISIGKTAYYIYFQVRQFWLRTSFLKCISKYKLYQGQYSILFIKVKLWMQHIWLISQVNILL